MYIYIYKDISIMATAAARKRGCDITRHRRFKCIYICISTYLSIYLSIYIYIYIYITG